MTEEFNQIYPAAYLAIDKATKDTAFSMASDPLTCSLLRTLACSKPKGSFLELGTGTGLSSSWILDGMDEASTMISLDNDAQYLSIAEKFLTNDKRIQLYCVDAADWKETSR